MGSGPGPQSANPHNRSYLMRSDKVLTPNGNGSESKDLLELETKQPRVDIFTLASLLGLPHVKKGVKNKTPKTLAQVPRI